MSHLGWVTALYLTANHLMTKGILFLVVAAIILRTGARTFADLGGLARPMPFTFAAAAIAIVAMSGLPPLAGFGGKWLLLSAMMKRVVSADSDGAARDVHRVSLHGEYSCKRHSSIRLRLGVPRLPSHQPHSSCRNIS